MMSPDEPRALIESLKSVEQWGEVRDALNGLDAALARDDPAARKLLPELEGHLWALSRHPKWEVRAAVARNARHLRQEYTLGLLARLVADENADVQRAARTSMTRRTPPAPSDMLREEHEVLLTEWLASLSPRSQAIARHAAIRYGELLIREAYHELVGAISVADAALENLDCALRAPRISRRQCLKRAARAREGLLLHSQILDSVHDLALEVTPVFRRESLRDVIDEAASRVKDRSKQRLRIALAGPATILDAHSTMLSQAFGNFLQNSLDAYVAKGVRRGRVEIEWKREGDACVVVSFSDLAGGMSEDVRRNAFQYFKSRKAGGLGYGLLLARKVIERLHHGRLELESKKGKGTTVRVVLPLEQPGREP